MTTVVITMMITVMIMVMKKSDSMFADSEGAGFSFGHVPSMTNSRRKFGETRREGSVGYLHGISQGTSAGTFTSL